MKQQLKLYLVLETQMLKKPLEVFIPEVVKNGVTAVQLRDKGMTAREQFETGQKLMELLTGTDVLFVVNDRIDLARCLGARAVHLGVKDIPLKRAKETFPDMIYGYSCNTKDDIEMAKLADYIGVGPAFMTGTKKDLRPVIAPEGIAELIKLTSKPAVAIGGINAENIHTLYGCGLSGVAVSSCICAAQDPARAAAEMREKAEKL
jgi:thiamine-phosphate pyrophosphorylase